MKKLFPLLLVVAVLAFGCKNKEKEDDNANNQEQTENNGENDENNNSPNDDDEITFGTPKDPVNPQEFLTGEPECDQILTEYADNMNNYVYLLEQLGEGKDVPNEKFDAISDRQEVIGTQMKDRGLKGEGDKCWGSFSRLSLKWAASASKAAAVLMERAMQDLQKMQ